MAQRAQKKSFDCHSALLPPTVIPHVVAESVFDVRDPAIPLRYMQEDGYPDPLIVILHYSPSVIPHVVAESTDPATSCRVTRQV